MAFTDQLGQAQAGRAATLANIELGIGAVANPAAAASLFVGAVQNRFLTIKVVQRATNQLITDPPNLDMATTETLPYVVDVTNYLGAADTVGSVSPVLTYLSTGKTVSGALGSSSISGNVITIPILGSGLSYGQQYQIAVTFQGSSSKVATYTSIIRVVA